MNIMARTLSKTVNKRRHKRSSSACFFPQKKCDKSSPHDYMIMLCKEAIKISFETLFCQKRFPKIELT